LADFGMTPQNTLLATALCRDEINQQSIQELAYDWGEHFDLAGLAGFLSAGITALRAYQSHVPEGGYLFIFYGPHVGITASGELGKVNRLERSKERASCGSLLSFLQKCQDQLNYTPSYSEFDVEKYYVESSLLSKMPHILANANPVKTLTQNAFIETKRLLHNLLEQLGFTRQIAIVGGITINTPRIESSVEDSFLPLQADILNYKNIEGETMSWLSRIL
jgi:hypothetical protein